jgi:hypothetical protein
LRVSTGGAKRVFDLGARRGYNKYPRKRLVLYGFEAPEDFEFPGGERCNFSPHKMAGNKTHLSPPGNSKSLRAIMKAVTFVLFNLGFRELQFTLLTILNLRQRTQNEQWPHEKTHDGSIRSFTSTSLDPGKSSYPYQCFSTHVTRPFFTFHHLNPPHCQSEYFEG